MLHKLFICLSLYFVFAIGNLFSMQPFENGPIHEAFVTRIEGEIVLEALPQQPPPDINETIPPAPDSDVSWIHGYWTWVPSKNDFVWVSGVWRVPPPEKMWNDGSWMKLDDGWVWLHGFWSPPLTEPRTYLQEAPPEPIEEDAGIPPGDNYFWNPGYWSYSDNTQEYQWVSGSWEELDFNWVLVPAHYVWRPEGYLFIPAYWDWPIDQRGRAYAPLVAAPEEREEEMMASPEEPLDSMMVLESTAEYYPDYAYLIQHHYHYHPDFWEGWAPSWWAWPRWWCLPWHDHWGLWWWYTHSGYPQPLWLTPGLARFIPPPSSRLLGLTNRLIPPAIVTPHGVVRGDALIRAAGKQRGRPIIPGKGLREIQTKALPKPVVGNILKPEGDRKLRADKLPLRDQPQPPRAALSKERIPKVGPVALPKRPGSEIPIKEKGRPIVPTPKKVGTKHVEPSTLPQEHRGPPIISPKSSTEIHQTPRLIPTPDRFRAPPQPSTPALPQKPIISRPPVRPGKVIPQLQPGSGQIRPNIPHIPSVRPYQPFPQGLPPESRQTGQVRPNVPHIPPVMPAGQRPINYPGRRFPGQPINPQIAPQTIIPRGPGFPQQLQRPQGPQVIPQQRPLPVNPQQIPRSQVVPQIQPQQRPQPTPQQIRAAPVQPQHPPQAAPRPPQQIPQQTHKPSPPPQAAKPAPPPPTQAAIQKRKELLTH